MMSTDKQIEHWFTYHAPQADQVERYQRLRDAAKRFAREIAACTKPSADQTAALRKVREAVMTANAAIACETPPHDPAMGPPPVPGPPGVA